MFSRNRSYGNFFPEYLTAEEKRSRADKAYARLAKGGHTLSPVRVSGRQLAETFWGKAWCRHLETFADFVNRLPRGRSYVRQNAVCHLEIGPGHIHGLVQGTELYKVDIDISPLPEARWTALKKSCSGQIYTLVSLLDGKLAPETIKVLCDPVEGLFPRPAEMRFKCSCPDMASMCKHVAAVLYGVGNRLDSSPDLLFVLRQLDVGELLSAEDMTSDRAFEAARGKSDLLDEEDLSSLFGIDLAQADQGAVRPGLSAETGEPGKSPNEYCRPESRREKGAQAVKGVAKRARRGQQAQEKIRVSAVPSSVVSARVSAEKRVPSGGGVSAGQSACRAGTVLWTGKQEGEMPSGTLPGRPVQVEKVRQGEPSLSAMNLEHPSGRDISVFRTACGMTPYAFASALHVTQPTLLRWEQSEYELNLRADSKKNLLRLQKKMLRKIAGERMSDS